MDKNYDDVLTNNIGISFDDAKALAFEYAKDCGRVIDEAREYENAFVFFDTKSDLIGDDFPLVIDKKDGSISFGFYQDDSNDVGDEINTWTFI